MSGDTSGGAQRDALHRAVARTLRDEIAAGCPAVGQAMPPERDLVARFGISRHTVREALRALTDEGLIERRQGADTRVIASRPHASYQPTIHSIDDLRQYAADTVLRVHDSRTGNLVRDEAQLLGQRTTEPWLRIEGVRWAAAQALCANRVFVAMPFAALLTDVRPGAELPISIHEMVCRRGGTAVAGVEQDILARPLPGPLASHLGARPGTMTLLFVRRYRDAKGSVIVWSLNWHPADRFVYRMRLDRSAS